MNLNEYEQIQKDLSHLMERDVMRHKNLNKRERDTYKQAVLACKSVISKYNPNNINI